MWQRWSGCGVLVLLLLVLGCGKKAQEKRYLVGFANAAWGDPWRVALNEQTRQAARQYPELELEIVNGQDKNDVQIAQVRNFIQKKVDVLIISPNEAAALTGVVEEAYKVGIPVVVIDRNITKETYTTFIGASNVEIGRAAGRYVERQFKGKAKVRIIEIRGTDGATATLDRNKGFMEIVKAHPEFEILDSQPALYKRSLAQDRMTTILQAHPEIDCVYAHNDEMAIGAYQAAKAVGREKSMIFVGIDGQESCIQMIREGKIHATFDYPRPGEAAIQAAVKILRREKVEKHIVLPTLEITKDNAKNVKGF